MNNYLAALTKLNGMIQGLEGGSTIPVMAGELKHLRTLLLNDCPPGNIPAGTVSNLQPVPMTLFPTLDSLQSVMTLAESQLPITSSNALTALLMCYHNTLLAQLAKNQGQP